MSESPGYNIITGESSWMIVTRCRWSLRAIATVALRIQGKHTRDSLALGLLIQPSLPVPAFADMSQAQIENARKYVARVKEMYGSDSRQYRGFLEALRDYRSRQLEPLDVIDRIAQLFKGDRSLIIGFNAFLPDEVSSLVLQGQ